MTLNLEKFSIEVESGSEDHVTYWEGTSKKQHPSKP